MIQINLCIRVIIFLCVSFVTIYADKDSFNVIYPQDNRLQTELTLNVVIETSASNFDAIKIVTSKEQIDIDLNSSKSMHCKNILLRLGENRISVRSYKNKKFVTEKIRHVYVTSQLYHQYKYPPEIYKKTIFIMTLMRLNV